MRYKRIGVVGGIASGKTTVTKTLQTLGCKVFDADKVAHGVLEEVEVLMTLIERWKLKTRPWHKSDDPKENVDYEYGRKLFRQEIGKIVFQNAAELKFLEDLMGPLIEVKLVKFLEDNKDSDVVLDIPLLIESNWTHYSNCLLGVVMDQTRRLQK